MLRERLFSRRENEETVEKVLADISPLIMEDKVIESRVHTYLSLGKTAQYIRLKLAQKKFDKTLVERFLSEKADIIKNSETYRHQIEKSIQK